MTERQGAAHRITSTRPGSASDAPRSSRVMPSENWKGTGVWQVSNTLGKLHSVASDPDDYGEHGLTSWESRKGGFVGQVETLQPMVGGQERSTYQTPAFRTPLRSQIGAEALSRRITKRGASADYYHEGTQYETHEEMMPEGASMRRRY
jgi:hypothetical protein